MAEPAAGGDAAGVAAPPEPTYQRRSALRNARDLLLSQGLTWGLAVVVTIVLPRFIGPAALGQIRLSTSVWAIALVAMNLGANNHIALEIAKKGEVAAAGIVSTVFVMRTLAFGVASLGVAAYVIGTGVPGDTALVFAIVGVATLPSALSNVSRAGLIGFEHMGYAGIADVVTKVVYVILTLGVLVLGGGAAAVVGVLVISNSLSAVLLWRYLRRFPGTAFRPTLAGARTIWRGSVGFLVAEIVIILYLQVDTVVLASLVDKRELGWYGTADMLYASLLFVPNILLSSLLPVMGRMHEEDPLGMRRLIARGFDTLVLVGVPLGFGTVIIAEPLSVLLFGESFRQTGGVLGVMGVVLVFGFLTILFGGTAMATGRKAFWNTLMIIAIVASVPLDLVLVPWMHRSWGNGAIGGALSYLITEGFLVTAGVWVIAPYLAVRHTLVRTLKIVVAGALMVAAAWPLRNVFLAVPVAVGAAVFIGAVLLLRAVSDDDREQVASLLARFRRSRAG